MPDELFSVDDDLLLLEGNLDITFVAIEKATLD
jgi:hypothetical protein